MNVALDTMANLIEGIGKILPNCLRTNSGILHCSETDRDRSCNVQIELTNNSNGRLFIRQSFFYAGRLYGGALLLIGERWVPLVSDGFSLWLQIGDFSVYLGNQDYLGFSSDCAIDDTIGR